MPSKNTVIPLYKSHLCNKWKYSRLGTISLNLNKPTWCWVMLKFVWFIMRVQYVYLKIWWGKDGSPLSSYIRIPLKKKICDLLIEKKITGYLYCRSHFFSRTQNFREFREVISNRENIVLAKDRNLAICSATSVSTCTRAFAFTSSSWPT